MLKLILKIWPALLPITIYILWVLVIERFLLPKKKVIEGQFKTVGEKSTSADEEQNLASETESTAPSLSQKFSLQNRNFVITLYLTLISAIIILVCAAFN